MNPVVTPTVGHMYAAVQSLDGFWYRARCDQIVNDQEVLVTFIDFGNKEIVPLAKMKMLLPHMAELPTMVS